MFSKLCHRSLLALGVAILVLGIALPATAVVGGYKITNESSELLIHELNGVLVFGTEIVVPPGGSTEALTVQWLDNTGAPINPASLPFPAYTLHVNIADTGVVTSTLLGQFVFRLNAVSESMTTTSLCLSHNGVCEFNGLAIETHVEEEHFEADGLVIRKNGVVIVHQWQGVLTGSIEVLNGASTDSLDVAFLDPDSLEGDLDDDPDFSMQIENDTPSIATMTALAKFSFRANGLQLGNGIIRLCLHHIDHCDFTSLDIPVEVLTATAVRPATPDLALRAFPNPFAGSTRLELSLGAEESVRIDVYDVAGRLVQTVHDGRKDAGVHSFALDSRGLASGVYFVKASTPSITNVRKIVIAR